MFVTHGDSGDYLFNSADAAATLPAIPCTTRGCHHRAITPSLHPDSTAG